MSEDCVPDEEHLDAERDCPVDSVRAGIILLGGPLTHSIEHPRSRCTDRWRDQVHGVDISQNAHRPCIIRDERQLQELNYHHYPN